MSKNSKIWIVIVVIVVILVGGDFIYKSTLVASINSRAQGVTSTATPPVVVSPPIIPPTTPPITTKPGALSIISIKPSGGSVGTNVILQGTGFNTTSQVVLDGGRGAIRQTTAKASGTLLTFTMPSSVGAYCLPDRACPMYEILLQPNIYTLEVRNADGSISNSVEFTLTN